MKSFSTQKSGKRFQERNLLSVAWRSILLVTKTIGFHFYHCQEKNIFPLTKFSKLTSEQNVECMRSALSLASSLSAHYLSK